MESTRVELPELGLVGEAPVSPPIDRLLAPRVTRGAPSVPPTIKSHVMLGGPDIARMRPRDDDDRHLAERWADSDFWSVLMSLSIDPKEPESVTSAWLKVRLKATDGGTSPIAFAMEPSREEAGEQIERSGTAGATIKVFKLSGGVKRSYTARHDEILALNRLRSDPAWELAPSPGRPLRPTDFVLVIKARKGAAASGTVSFGAEVDWRSGLFRRCEVTWPGEQVRFSLTPAASGGAST
jgi:hypothetical protein